MPSLYHFHSLFIIGQGPSKKAAKQEAAMVALKILELDVEKW